MCLACQMEGEWLAYLEELARRELQQGEAPAAGAAEPAQGAAKPAPASPFVCEEQLSE